MHYIRSKLTYTQIIALGFLTVILIGATLLCLPVSSRDGVWTAPINSLFTATSATCVTGQIVFDTYTHWSLFGQIVIISMIQIGGLGFMTVITMFSIFLNRHIGLHERRLLMQSAGTLKISGIVKLIKRIFIGTLIFEGTGAIILAIRFFPKMGFTHALYYGVFHSISAFCNAGFDIMGKYDGPNSSFTNYVSDPVVSLTIASLIVIGGIGFLVWNDIAICKFNFRKYQLHSKIVLITTFSLITIGAVLFFIFEYNFAMYGLNIKGRILASLFQAITPRTAGFNTIDMASLSQSGSLLTVILMYIGGSPGSTAGGIKTTTFVVLIMGVIASARNRNSITIFKRRLDDGIVKQASAIATIYMFAILSATLIICALEPFTIREVLFEVTSCAGTVGLSMGITSSLGVISKTILIILMYGGRVGGLSLMLVLAEKRSNVPLERPTEKILIG